MVEALRQKKGWQRLIKRGVHTLRKPEYQARSILISLSELSPRMHLVVYLKASTFHLKPSIVFLCVPWSWFEVIRLIFVMLPELLQRIETMTKLYLQLCFVEPGIATGEELEKLKVLDSVLHQY